MLKNKQLSRLSEIIDSAADAAATKKMAND